MTIIGVTLVATDSCRYICHTYAKHVMIKTKISVHVDDTNNLIITFIFIMKSC
jgi:hypothetical protein